ncbi:MAG: hypothetical protein ABSF45_25165 [Terriglobia bacterium]
MNFGSRDVKTRGEKMKDSLAMLLKTNVEKMSIYGLLAMLKKKNELKSLSGDVDENKWENRWARAQEKLLVGAAHSPMAFGGGSFS